MANRGVATDRVVQVLAAQLKELDRADEASEDSRRWAVEGLALVGTTPTIAPLLDAMRNDPSAMVRERAACTLAQSGMLSHDQRLIAVPRLIDYAEDPALDAQTRGWAFQALADITQTTPAQRLRCLAELVSEQRRGKLSCLKAFSRVLRTLLPLS